MAKQQDDLKVDRFWSIAMKGTIPIVVAIGSLIIAQEIRLARIEENRFTNVDGVRLERELKFWVESRYPPNSLLEDVKEIKTDIRSIKDRMRVLEVNQ